MDFPKHFAMRIYAFVFSMILVFIIFIAMPVQAASLHTFKQYAAMTGRQQNKVRTYAAGVIFKNALTRGDKKQARCLRVKFLSKFGKEMDVQLEHASLRGKIEAEIEIEREAVKPDPRKRVEYLVANHLQQVCPPTPEQKVEFHFYGPSLKRVVPYPNLGVMDKSADLSGS